MLERKQSPALSVIIPWCDRPELHTTLAHNLPVLAAHPLEVIVVNCGGDFNWIRHQFGGQTFGSIRWMHLGGTGFNKSLALNLGVATSRAPRLFFLDTDIIFIEDIFTKAMKSLHKNTYVIIDRVVESNNASQGLTGALQELAYSIELVTEHNRARVETNRIRFGNRSRSAPGLVFLLKEHYQQVNGMNADLEGWGWEDIDLLVRLQLSLGLKQRQVGQVIHLSHGDELRQTGRGGKAASEAKNFASCLANYHLANYAGTYLQDWERWRSQLELYDSSLDFRV